MVLSLKYGIGNYNDFKKNGPISATVNSTGMFYIEFSYFNTHSASKKYFSRMRWFLKKGLALKFIN